MRFEDLRVLLVDEKASMRRQIGTMLCQIGILSFGEADNGLAGLDLLRDRLPDLLMIGQVPDSGDGIAYTRQVREEVSDSLPIILVAGYADLWRLGEAKDAGATEFLVRPFTMRALTQRIQRAAAFHRKAALRVV
jgi:PleD family two-component response regulator